MSKKIGQFFSEENSGYLSDNIIPENNIPLYIDKTSSIGGLVFQDLFLSGTFEKDIDYYISMSLKNITENLGLQDDIQVTVSLCNIRNTGTDEQNPVYKMDDIVQNLTQLKIDKTNGSSFNFIFRPNHTYNAIIFTCTRRIEEFTSNGKTIKLEPEDMKLYTVTNILGGKINTPSVTKLGIQANPGLLFCINGEQIMMNSSGFYEMLADIQVKELGFIIKEDEPTVKLIVDYQYIVD